MRTTLFINSWQVYLKGQSTARQATFGVQQTTLEYYSDGSDFEPQPLHLPKTKHSGATRFGARYYAGGIPYWPPLRCSTPSIGVTVRSMGAPASEDSTPEGRTGKPTLCCMASSAKTWLDIRTDTGNTSYIFVN